MGAALRGDNPTVLRRMTSGFAVIGDVQFLPGYCVLITDTPGVDRLTDLPRDRRLAFLDDLERLGEAVQTVCARRDPAFRRINLEILGNTDPFLHAHVWPRYEWEGAAVAAKPVWLYPPTEWSEPSPQTALGPATTTCAPTSSASSTASARSAPRKTRTPVRRRAIVTSCPWPSRARSSTPLTRSSSPLSAGLSRAELSRGAWVDYHPGWLAGADRLFEELHTAVPWHAERREMYERMVDVPRLLKFYDEDEVLPHPSSPRRARCWAGTTRRSSASAL